jgi:predicted RecA/RadA family phage recombinase
MYAVLIHSENLSTKGRTVELNQPQNIASFGGSTVQIGCVLSLDR